MSIVCPRRFLLVLLILLWPMRASADVAPKPDYRYIGELRIHIDGDDDPAAWQHQTEGQQSEAVTKLKDFATGAQKTEHLKMRLIETSHFLIYTDNGIAANLAKEDGAYLESAYTGLNKVFNAEPGDAGQGLNIWQGKALVFIFSDNDLAEDFLRVVYRLNIAISPLPDIRSPPLVSLNKSGSVAVVAAQPDIFRDAKRAMVSAMADAYLFRLHSSSPIAPWVEAGLVLAVADSIHYQPNQNSMSDAQLARQIYLDGLGFVRSNDIEHILDSNEPAPWACEGLVSYLIGQSPSKMATFVRAMKDGKDWEDAMKDIYQLTPSGLKTAYVNSVGNNQ